MLANSLGATSGALLRWQLGLRLNSFFPALPPGTLTANLIGGYVIGFATLARELDDNYFRLIDRQLKRLRFRDGILVSAGLGKGLKGQNYILRRPLAPADWLTRLTRTVEKAVCRRPPDAYTLYLAPRDEQGARAMSELMDRALGLQPTPSPRARSTSRASS